MASMKEHMAQFHESEAAHHEHKAEHHADMAGHYRKLASSLGKTATTEAQADSKATLETMAGMHEETSQKHAAHAEYHKSCAEKCSKATDAIDLNKLQPSAVSAIAPERPTITPVPRAGSRPFPTSAATDDEFLKTIIGTAEDHTEEMSLQK